ncbi:MAG: NTP transferase domain-containing protein [Gemmiger sp.]|nr:NTP transferase domain-containing protein [Gemmiger sp.]
MPKLHLILPMAGRGSRFFENGFVQPKPLIEINGAPFFYWATQSIAKFVDTADITFVVLDEHIRDFAIDAKIHQWYPNARILALPEVTAGAAVTCLQGAAPLPDDEPLLFNDCDHLFLSTPFYDFCRAGNFVNGPDGALLTFDSQSPAYSYLQYDAAGNVCRTVEKQVVSRDAICGAYYFKDKATYATATATYLENCAYTEFFVSGVYNVLAQTGKTVRGFATDLHLPFGTLAEYFAAETPQNAKGFKALRP